MMMTRQYIEWTVDPSFISACLVISNSAILLLHWLFPSSGGHGYILDFSLPPYPVQYVLHSTWLSVFLSRSLMVLYWCIYDSSYSTFPSSLLLTYLFYGSRLLSGRTPDSQSNEPGFESPFATVSKIGHFRSLH